MKLAGWLLGSTALVALAAQSAPALACGASAPPYYVVASASPSGDDVPLNAPLLVELAESADGPVYEEMSPRLVLTIKGDDRALPVLAGGLAPHLVWVPSEPLLPNTISEAHYNPGYEGHPDRIWQFTTGDSVTPPVALEGALRASLEAGRDPILECSDCGASCVEKEQRAVTKARLRLPVVKDGFEPRRGELWLTDDTAYDFALPDKDSAPSTEGHVVALVTSVAFDAEGKPTGDVLVTLPEEDEPYRPCFALRVTDARGDQASAEPLCLTESFPAADTESDPPPVVTDREANTSSACAFGTKKSGHGSLLGALLCVGAALLRRSPQHRS